MQENYTIPRVNGHIHTPYSFSAFESIEQALKLSVSEDIKVLGINDFNTVDGYDEFYENCMLNKVYPLFNIEFIGLLKDMQQQNLRINDPNNPGRIYLSGKGLSYPFKLQQEFKDKINSLQKLSNSHSIKLIDRVNEYFCSINIPVKLDFEAIKTIFTKGLVRERHIAKAVRIAICNLAQDGYPVDEVFVKLFNDKQFKQTKQDNALFENVLRNFLLKRGGPAFVQEDETAFLNINDLCEIIISAGGMPCYPVLLDDTKGNLTDFEQDRDKMHQFFTVHKIACLELIPSRNNCDILTDFVKYFHKKGYIIIFGTEHNTPELTSMRVACRNNISLSKELSEISFEAASVIAAHQYIKKSLSALPAELEGGFLDNDNFPKKELIKEFATFGKKLIFNCFK